MNEYYFGDVRNKKKYKKNKQTKFQKKKIFHAFAYLDYI